MAELISIAPNRIHNLLFSTSLSTCDFSKLFILFHFIYNSHLAAAMWHAIFTLVCLSLMANDSEFFFHLSSEHVICFILKIPIYVILSVFNWLFLLIHFSVLCVFWVLIHCKINSWQRFSPIL